MYDTSNYESQPRISDVSPEVLSVGKARTNFIDRATEGVVLDFMSRQRRKNPIKAQVALNTQVTPMETRPVASVTDLQAYQDARPIETAPVDASLAEELATDQEATVARLRKQIEDLNAQEAA